MEPAYRLCIELNRNPITTIIFAGNFSRDEPREDTKDLFVWINDAKEKLSLWQIKVP